jgi:DNA-binding response OmpR family regulator
MDLLALPPTTQARIIVVEDQETARKTFVRALELRGYAVLGVSSGEEALEALAAAEYDLMLLDLRLPGMQGEEVMRQVRRLYPHLMVIIITAYGTLETAIAAVRMGAVDYLLKPCPLQEVEAAVARALRRRHVEMRRQYLIKMISQALEALKAEEEASATLNNPADRFLRGGSLLLDREKRLVVVADTADEAGSQTTELTANEAVLLAYLLQHPETVISCRDLACLALGYDVDEIGAQGIVRPHISRLRHKLERDPSRPRLIRTVRGRGYLLSL